MKAILRTNDFSENYVIVDVVKNPISATNKLAEVIENGKTVWTGGILCEYSSRTIAVLDSLTESEQWNWLMSIRNGCVL